jgi:CheY-like chemotaxis protein
MLKEPAQIRIYVQDTGIGIKQEDIPLLFEEFKQLDSTPTRQYGGTGLGLSITKKIVELFHGTVQVKSTVGVGSTFIITLPLVVESAGEVPLPVKVPEPVKPPEKIILSIDDDPEVLTLLADSLQGAGYKCVGAQNGQEGLALARQLQPHAITLDIMMPHMDGWSVLRLLKNDPKLRHIPVFIVSVIENKALGFSLGVTDYIVKPFDRKELLEKLASCDKAAPHKVLVVDDDPIISQLFEEAIKQAGYAVEVAFNGKEALAKMAKDKPDILFLDLMMPQMSGFDVLEAIGKDPALKGVRVFVMTAKHLTPQETDYLEQRVEMIVQKGARTVEEVFSILKEKLNVIKEAAA